MEFSPNSTFLYIVAICVIIFILVQATFFLVRAYRRGKELGMDVKVLRKTVVTSIIFTIAPAISILIGIIALSNFLGIPLPWIRLSVVGSLNYELTAVEATAKAMLVSTQNLLTDPQTYVTIAWVMTLGILPSLIFPSLLMNKIKGGILKIKSKDEKWGNIFVTSIFLGMISAFLGVVFADVRTGLSGWIPVFVLLVSALVMALCGLIIKVFKANWLETYAMPISLVAAMASAIGFTQLFS